MIILLPPSETKRAGGDGAPFSPDNVSLPTLAPLRERVIDALVALSTDEDEAARVLKLSVRQRADIAHNAQLRTALTMPALDRYTGVLFDGLSPSTLSEAERVWMGEHVLIHSAPFGPIGALDPLPLYRLAAGASLPALGSLKKLWAPAVSSALSDRAPAFVVDLRSEAYVSLGPVPSSVASVYVRVLSAGADGVVRALNHFNKKAKGEFVRALAQSQASVSSIADLHHWAAAHGWNVRDHADGEIALIV